MFGIVGMQPGMQPGTQPGMQGMQPPQGQQPPQQPRNMASGFYAQYQPLSWDDASKAKAEFFTVPCCVPL